MEKPGGVEHIVVRSHEGDQCSIIISALHIILTRLNVVLQVFFVDRTGLKEKARVVMQRGMVIMGDGWSGPATQSIGKLAGIQNDS